MLSMDRAGVFGIWTLIFRRLKPLGSSTASLHIEPKRVRRSQDRVSLFKSDAEQRLSQSCEQMIQGSERSLGDGAL